MRKITGRSVAQWRRAKDDVTMELPEKAGCPAPMPGGPVTIADADADAAADALASLDAEEQIAAVATTTTN